MFSAVPAEVCMLTSQPRPGLSNNATFQHRRRLQFIREIQMRGKLAHSKEPCSKRHTSVGVLGACQGILERSTPQCSAYWLLFIKAYTRIAGVRSFPDRHLSVWTRAQGTTESGASTDLCCGVVREERGETSDRSRTVLVQKRRQRFRDL